MMPRGLKTKLRKPGPPKVEKGIAPMVKVPKSKAFGNLSASLGNEPTLFKKSKSKKY